MAKGAESTGGPDHSQPARQPLDSPGPWGESPTQTLALQIQEVENWTQGRPQPRRAELRGTLGSCLKVRPTQAPLQAAVQPSRRRVRPRPRAGATGPGTAPPCTLRRTAWLRGSKAGGHTEYRPPSGEDSPCWTDTEADFRAAG